MARPAHELLRPLLLAVCLLPLLLQVSECSRPSSPSPADHLDDDALHHQLLLLDAEARSTARPPTSTEAVAGDDGRTGADEAVTAPSSSAPATPAWAVGAVASSRPRRTSDRALLVRAGMPLRSKLARRFLAGAGVGVDDAATAMDGAVASCQSHNPHINCPPASKP